MAAERFREEIATQLATQQSVWQTERATLLAQLEAANVGKSIVEAQLAEAKEVCSHKEIELHAVTLMLKEVVETNSQIQADLDICTQQVYQLRWKMNSSGSQPPVPGMPPSTS